MDIPETILSDPVNRWILSKVRGEVFLVGGYVRDLLRGEVSKDKDFVLKGDVKKFASEVAKKFNGTFVTLKEGIAYRVALKNKEFIDFAYLRESIEEDLKQRDFTIDAIAWSPKTGIIDPSGGSKDLKNRLIRVVIPTNLAEDPLRVLRAYRLAAQLGFTIEEATRRHLRDYAEGLLSVAAERITEELFKILNTSNARISLQSCYKDRVLEKIVRLRPGRLRENLKLFVKFESLYQRSKKKWDLDAEISQGLTRAGLIRLALLLMHGEHIIHKDRPLKLSRAIKKALRGTHNGYRMIKWKVTDGKLFKIFRTVNNNVLETAIVLSIMKEKNKKRILKGAERFINTKEKMLLTGDEIQRILKIAPGVLVGKILSALQEKQFHGVLKTKAEAKAWLLSNFT